MIERNPFNDDLPTYWQRATPVGGQSVYTVRVAAVFVALLLLLGNRAPTPARAQVPIVPTATPDAEAVLETSLAASINPATVGQAVSFTYTAIPLDATHSPSELTLDFGDGQEATIPPAASGPTSGSINHSYATVDTYTVTFSAAADDGTSSVTPLMITVVDAGAADQPSNGQTGTGIVGLPMMFTAAGSTANSCGTIQSYQFDFGDGTPAVSGQEVSHTFAAPGTYTVTITVTDCAGVTATSASQIAILPVPQPAS